MMDVSPCYPKFPKDLKGKERYVEGSASAKFGANISYFFSLWDSLVL